MTNKQKHRNPTLFIVGNHERADEIKLIIEDEWGGTRDNSHIDYSNTSTVYFVGSFGYVSYCSLGSDFLRMAIEDGWMKEYKLPEKAQFKPFDKVVVKANGRTWCPALFGYREENEYCIQGYGWVDIEKSIILPYNEQTAKLIGTCDEWEGGDNE